MKRREFLGLVGGVAADWPLTSGAQKAPIRIGFLASGTATSANSAAQVDAIRQGLRDNGLMGGKDYLLDTRFAAGNYQQFPEMARDLVQAVCGSFLSPPSLRFVRRRN
jgi:putative ABC transport system substrate-binding protein